MIVTLMEPGEIVRTIDAERRYIRTFMVNNYGDLIRYDDGLQEATGNTATRLDAKVADQ
jgi:hypothetical protein